MFAFFATKWAATKLFLGTPLGRKVLVGGAIALAVGVLLFWIYGAGKDAGRQDESQRWTDNEVKEWQGERETLQVDLSRLRAARQEAEQREERWASLYQAERQVSAQKDSRLLELARNRTEARTRFDQVADSDLERQIKQDLGLRATGALDTPGFTVTELRTLGAVVVDYPLVNEQNQTLREKMGSLDKQIEALGERVTAVQDRVAATEAESRAWKGYALDVEGHYVNAYNALGNKKRSAKCLWIWSCGKKKLEVPNPAELTRPAPITIEEVNQP